MVGVVRAFDLAETSVRDLNQFLHHDLGRVNEVEINNPNGQHSIAVGLNADIDVRIHGHAGYFIAGMNQQARVTIHGNVGWSVGENMMSGTVRVKGHASQSAGASSHGGLLVIEGDASSRCGISLKGGDIVVAGGVGHFSGFMAQAGNIVICGDAAANLGDSLYEANIYVLGSLTSLGADAQQEDLEEEDVGRLTRLLSEAQIREDAQKFKKIASAKTLYHWNPHTGASVV